jgi:predicted transcriptional regulator
MQMVARCETVGKYILPVFRSLIARELINTYKLTQVDAAQRLGTTQAAISQYINSKRAFKGTEKLGDIMPQLQAMACDAARRLAKHEMRPEEISVDFCKLCPTFCSRAAASLGDDFAI